MVRLFTTRSKHSSSLPLLSRPTHQITLTGIQVILMARRDGRLVRSYRTSRLGNQQVRHASCLDKSVGRLVQLAAAAACDGQPPSAGIRVFRVLPQSQLISPTPENGADDMSTSSIVILVVVLFLLFGGGGYYWRRGRN
jgi:hypothetical protein